MMKTLLIIATIVAVVGSFDNTTKKAATENKTDAAIDDDQVETPKPKPKLDEQKIICMSVSSISEDGRIPENLYRLYINSDRPYGTNLSTKTNDDKLDLDENDEELQDELIAVHSKYDGTLSGISQIDDGDNYDDYDFDIFEEEVREQENLCGEGFRPGGCGPSRRNVGVDVGLLKLVRLVVELATKSTKMSSECTCPKEDAVVPIVVKKNVVSKKSPVKNKTKYKKSGKSKTHKPKKASKRPSKKITKKRKHTPKKTKSKSKKKSWISSSRSRPKPKAMRPTGVMRYTPMRRG